MVLYAEAMPHMQFISSSLWWLVDPYNTPSTSEEEIRQRNDLRQVPDQITARIRLVAHDSVREAWLELLNAEEGFGQ
jgi:hypothetical protein